MRIEVVYDDRPPRIIETSGEAMLSASTVAESPEWHGTALPVTAVMLRPRTDLLMRGGASLVVELCAWSAATDGWGEEATVSDFGYETGAPCLQFHVFRVWEVLPASDVAHAVDIDIDGFVHVRRVGGSLLDLTCYERMEEHVLSKSELGERPFDQRVLLLHDRLRREHPGMTDAEIGNTYGLGNALFDYALSIGGDGDDGVGDDDGVPVRADGGLDDLVVAISATTSRNDRVLILEGAILDRPDLTLEALGSAFESHGLDCGELAELWAEAEGGIGDEDLWGDLDWDERG